MNATLALRFASILVLISSACQHANSADIASPSSDQLLLTISKLADPRLTSTPNLVEFLGALVVDPDFKLPAPLKDVYYPASLGGLEKIRIYRAERNSYVEVYLVLSKETCLSDKALSDLFERDYQIPSSKNYRHKDIATGWVSESGGPDWGPEMTVHRAKPHDSLLISYRVFSRRPEACVDGPKFIYSPTKD